MMIFKDSRIYDFLKWLALVALDAIGIAYQSLANVWSLPYGDEVCKTCTILSVLLGALIGVSSRAYRIQQEEIHALQEQQEEVE